MDLYHVWCDLKPGESDLVFVRDLNRFLTAMREAKEIASFRVTRCKLGLKPDGFPEWHIMIETSDLAQLDRAFQTASSRAGEIDTLHFAANAKVQNVKFALYRDFPDPQRVGSVEG